MFDFLRRRTYLFAGTVVLLPTWATAWADIERYDDYLYFKSELENGGALSRTVMFVHTAADPTVECLKIPDMSLAVAEQFALQGKDVLVLLTDMTNFTDSMKEIAITMNPMMKFPSEKTNKPVGVSDFMNTL